MAPTTSMTNQEYEDRIRTRFPNLFGRFHDELIQYATLYPDDEGHNWLDFYHEVTKHIEPAGEQKQMLHRLLKLSLEVWEEMIRKGVPLSERNFLLSRVWTMVVVDVDKSEGVIPKMKVAEYMSELKKCCEILSK